MPAELRPDDEVTDWQYQWQGPDGAESWWPAMPFVHAQIYMVTLFPAFRSACCWPGASAPA